MLTKAEKKAVAALLPTLYLPLLEELAVRRALEETNGNQTHAAKLLGMSVRTLQRKIVSLGLAPSPRDWFSG